MVNTATVTTVPGTDAAGAFEEPWAVITLMDGSLVVADSAKHVIQRVIGGTVATFAGTGVAGSLNGLAAEAQFRSPTGLALESRHDAAYVYVADRGNSLLRRIRLSPQTGEAVSVERIEEFLQVSAVVTADAMEPVILGSEDSGTVWEVTDGAVRILPVSAGFSGAGGVALDERRNVFVSDILRSEIRRMAPGGEVQTIAAQLNQPRGMALDAGGNIYVVESGRHAVTKISAGGINTVVAGQGSDGMQNGNAQEALFNSPAGICFRTGALIVADTGNRCLREIRFTPVGVSDPAIEIGVTGSLLISVSGVAGATFAIESSDCVGAAAEWRFGGNVAANAAEKLSLPKPVATRFYRARRLP